MTVALAIFALSYLIIAGQKIPWTRLDRPSGALTGAVGMVALGVLAPREVYQDAINWDTLALLLGMMILTAYLTEAAAFRWASWLVVTHARTPRRLLVLTVFVAGGLSALLVNDAVCLMFTPLVVRVVEDARLKPLPFLLALCFGSNAGSVATLTGNPQNMIVGTLSGIHYARFTAALGPAALLSLAIVAGLLLWMFRHDLPRRPLVPEPLPRPHLDRRLLTVCLVALTLDVAGFLAGFNLAWTAMTGAALVVVVSGHSKHPREVMQRVDWVLLVFFAGLFVVVHGVEKVGATARMFDLVAPLLGESAASQVLRFGALTVVGSQIFSNVPFVILAGSWMHRFAEPGLMWLSVALLSTLAGNLTIVGSVANLIVLELAGEHGRVGFWRFFRAGSVVTLATCAATLAQLFLWRWAGWL